MEDKEFATQTNLWPIYTCIKIGKDPDLPNYDPHDTSILIASPIKPAHPTPIPLWFKPVDTAGFLALPLNYLYSID